MGQAKNRGNREERIAQAKARQEALRPDKLICNHCAAEVHELEELDVGGMEGIEAGFAGICGQCGQTTWAFRGDNDAIATVMAQIEEETGGPGQLGFQTIK